MGIFSAKRLVFVILLGALGFGLYYFRDVLDPTKSLSDAPVAKKGAAAGGAAGAGGRGGRGGPRGTELVKMVTVEQKNMPVRVEGIGNVEAFTFVQIKARVDGQIIAVNFKEGQEVKKGDILFRIDPRPYEATLRLAEAALARDRALAERAAAQEVRQKELLDKKFVSTDNYSQFRANADATTAAMRASEAQIETARVQLDYTTIRSPITGYVGKIALQLGNIARAADPLPMATINQVQPIYVVFAIPEQRLADVRKNMRGGSLVVEAIPSDAKGKPSTGRLVFIDNAVDQSTGTIKLRAQFENADNALWPGQFANVRAKLFDDPKALVVPSVAIQTGPNGQFVFAVKEDDTVEVRLIKAARSDGDLTVIAEGLQAGERVVTEGQLRLAAGSKVTTAEAQAAARAKAAEGKGEGKAGDGKGGAGKAGEGKGGAGKAADKG